MWRKLGESATFALSTSQNGGSGKITDVGRHGRVEGGRREQGSKRDGRAGTREM